jgi:hypothetical protein
VSIFFAAVYVVRIAVQLIEELATETFTRPLQRLLEFFIVHGAFQVAEGASKVIVAEFVGVG